MIMYRIVRTECSPRQWKVKGVGVRDDNAVMWYHKTYDDALKQIDNLCGILSDDSDFPRAGEE